MPYIGERENTKGIPVKENTKYLPHFYQKTRF